MLGIKSGSGINLKKKIGRRGRNRKESRRGEIGRRTERGNCKVHNRDKKKKKKRTGINREGSGDRDGKKEQGKGEIVKKTENERQSKLS